MEYRKEIIPKKRRVQLRQKAGSVKSKGRRIEPALLWSQDPTSRTLVR